MAEVECGGYRLRIVMREIESSQSQTDNIQEPSVRVGAGHISPATLRLRAFVIGILLIPIDNYWVFLMDRLGKGPGVTMISLFANAIFALALLLLVNQVIRRIAPKQAFSQMEMLVIYTMICIGTAFTAQDWMANLIQMIGHPFYFAKPENKWAETICPFIPRPGLVTIKDMTVLDGFYKGNTSLYLKQYLVAWFPPVIIWSLFVTVLLYVMMCINTMVRKQWVERERLTFPIAQLPIAMTEPDSSFWKNRLLWIGFAVAGAYTLINGLHFLYPSIPLIYDNFGPTSDMRNFMVTKPWTGIDRLPVRFHPFVTGLGYLLPTDLLFSCWFFYFIWKAQMVITTAMAWDAIPNFPFINQQSFGGYTAILVGMLWTGRSYFKQVWLRIIGKPSELDDSDEAMSYRTAAIGGLLGTIALSAFFSWMGLNFVIAFVGFLIYWAISTAIARIRAELGPPVHDMHQCGPGTLITQFMGTKHTGLMDARGLSALAYFWWFNRAYRQHPIAFEIEGMKMASTVRASQKKVLYAVIIAAFVGSVAAFWAYLHFAYQMGYTNKIFGGTFRGDDIFGKQLYNWIANPTGPNAPANFAVIFGFVFCLLLGAIRLRWFGFPLHPIGYAISGTWSMNYVWLPLLIAWILKIIVLKVGGLKLFKSALPFFLGLILGEVIVGCLWSLVGIAFNIPTYSFW